MIARQKIDTINSASKSPLFFQLTLSEAFVVEYLQTIDSTHTASLKNCTLSLARGGWMLAILKLQKSKEV